MIDLVYLHEQLLILGLCSQDFFVGVLSMFFDSPVHTDRTTW